MSATTFSNACLRGWFGVSVILVAIGLLGADEKPVEVKVGDRAPDFQSTDDQGKTWRLKDHLGKKVIVLYFYPADLTPSCTAQACSFRDDMEKLADKGIEVVGVSGDTVKNHELFKKVHKLNFTLLADDKGEVAKKYGVPVRAGGDYPAKDAEGNPVVVTRGVTIRRWTFVIGKDGKVLYKNTNVVPAKDSKQILELIDKLKK
jgi:peroxiredoxin Q/BCP